MVRKEIDVFSDASNFAIVRMPGRNSPGCVIQGDSLWTLASDAKKILEHVRQGKKPIELAEALVKSLSVRLDHYEKVLKQNGIELPYPSP